MIPQQEEALNRAIAEFEGLDYDYEVTEWAAAGDVLKCNYTSDLNAIVDVVQRWCKGDSYKHSQRRNEMNKRYSEWNIYDTCQLVRHKQPALALCIAFAQAAGIKWEKE